MSPAPFSSNDPSQNDPSSGAGDDLAKAFYQTAKKPKNASTRIEAALKIFCDDFSIEKAKSIGGFHPSLETLSNYLHESADSNFSDLKDRFRRGRRIIEYSITNHLGISEAATFARQIADTSFVTDMGTCLSKQKMTSTINEHYLKLREHHLDLFLLRTESSIQYLEIVKENTPKSSPQSNEAHMRLIADCEAAAKVMKAHIHQWVYLLERHFPYLISEAVDELRELVPDMTVNFSDALKEEILHSLKEKFLNSLSQILQEQSAEVDLCVTAMKRVFSEVITDEGLQS